MVRPVKEKAGSPDVYQQGYQQAKEDFAIANLLTRLKTYSDADFDAAWMNITPCKCPFDLLSPAILSVGWL